jgi:hypothetical protein
MRLGKGWKCGVDTDIDRDHPKRQLLPGEMPCPAMFEFIAFLDSATLNAAGRANVALPCCTVVVRRSGRSPALPYPPQRQLNSITTGRRRLSQHTAHLLHKVKPRVKTKLRLGQPVEQSQQLNTLSGTHRLVDVVCAGVESLP